MGINKKPAREPINRRETQMPSLESVIGTVCTSAPVTSGSNEQCGATGFYNSKRFGNAAPWIGPIFDATGRDITVEMIGRVGEVFSVAKVKGAVCQILFFLCMCHLMRALIDAGDFFCINLLHNSLCCKPCSGSDIDG